MKEQLGPWWVWVAGFAIMALCITLISSKRPLPKEPVVQGVVHIPTQPRTFAELIALAPDQLARVDLARANLLCAEGLPGSEGLDVERCLRTLDQWAQRVSSETQRNFGRHVAMPEETNGSLAKYLMGMVVTVLQQDLGVVYDHDLRGWEWPFTDSRNFLLHGMLGYGKGGSCASMPVLYTVIAHRLGYPVFLARTKGHVFCRWEGSFKGKPAERMNIEGAGDGFSTFDDDYYRTWPAPFSPEEERQGGYLLSLRPIEAIAGFIGCRAACFRDLERWEEAYETYLIAARLDPRGGVYARTAGEARQGLARKVADERATVEALVKETYALNQAAEARRMGYRPVDPMEDLLPEMPRGTGPVPPIPDPLMGPDPRW